MTTDPIARTGRLWTDPADPGVPWYVEVVWGDVGADQPEPVAVTFWRSARPAEDGSDHFVPLGSGPKKVTVQGLKRLGIGAVIDSLRKEVRAVEAASKELYADAENLPSQVRLTDGDGPYAFTADRKPIGRPPRYGAAHYARVAVVYRAARADPVKSKAARKAVADHFTDELGEAISLDTASDWLRRCRKDGLIGPTTRGVAGEQRPTDKEH